MQHDITPHVLVFAKRRLQTVASASEKPIRFSVFLIARLIRKSSRVALPMARDKRRPREPQKCQR